MLLTNYRSACLIAATGLCCLIVPVKQTWAVETPLRVAVIDTGDNLAAPPAQLDLIVAQLSQQPGLALLERQQIDAVLREQQRNLVLSEKETTDNFIAAGRILGADVLVLISSSPPNEQGLQPIEVRIVETRRGIRFGETVLIWSADEQADAEQFESATAFITSRLSRVRTSERKYTLVSLAGFRTDELSQEAHRFKRSIEAWLEAWLASQPGIAVAERTKVLPLIDERNLASDLPSALGNADAAIDGTFKLDFSGDFPQVELTLRVLRKDRSAVSRTLHAPIRDLAKLRESAGKAIIELLDLVLKAAEFDAEAEARLLTDEAERLLSLGRRYESLQRLITAYSLEPDSLRTQTLLLNAGRQLGVGPDLSGAKFDGPFYPTALLLSDVARQVLDQIEQQRLRPGDNNQYERKEMFARIGDFCSLMSQIQFIVSEPTESQSIQAEWLRQAVEVLFAQYLNAVERVGGTPYEYAIFTGLSTSRYWAKSPDKALNQRFELFQRAARLDQPQQLGIWAFTTDHRFRLSDDKNWTQQHELVPLYEAYFEKMQDSNQPLMQAVGEREAAQFALWFLNDSTRALDHYRRFIAHIVNEIIPQYPAFADHVHGLWLDLNHWSGELALTDEEAGALWSQVILARWDPQGNCPQSSQPWEYRITLTLQLLERAGQFDKANELLQRCIDVLQTAPEELAVHEVSSQWPRTLSRLNQLQQGLQERHPGLGTTSNQIAVLPVDCQPLLQAAGLPELLKAQDVPVSSWRFTDLIATKDGYAVTSEAQEAQVKKFQTRVWLAVIRLDRKGNVLSSTLCSKPMEFDYRTSRQSGIAGQFHRTFASSDGNLFVAIPVNGIVWFPWDGAPVHYSAKYLENSDPNHRPVPFEEARQLTPINDKLYFTSGKDLFHPQIFELDYRSGRTTLLFDTQSINKRSPLHGRIGYSISEGPPGELLLWACHDRNQRDESFSRPPLGDLFKVILQDKSIHQAKPPFYIAHPGTTLSDQHHLGFQSPQGAMARFNPATLSLEWLLGNQSDPPFSGIGLSLQQFVYNEKYLLTPTKQLYKTSSRKWDLHAHGSLSPKQLLADNLPPPEKVLRYLIDDQRQVLVMTSKELYRVELFEEESR
ncbi:hypothetical protein [Bythopirellula goksoeyrii]|uniref:Curli production assembly/transport component CsgG n=1 Tax=Bythopirellula goksoeyrii TaxID=1400387 RepID=A0A5B9QQW5_9BACT|nr:hypothetical protein [Bythopirellula goksoeyrii]QEG36521.1 hypothetical protein Pr1d_38350 [Bythopirellula goksoeyrii]